MTSHFNQKLNGIKRRFWCLQVRKCLSLHAADADILTSAAHIRPAEAFARRLSLMGSLKCRRIRHRLSQGVGDVGTSRA